MARSPSPDRLEAADADRLLWYAVAAIRSGLEQRPIPGIRAPEAPALRGMGATFVTLELAGRLLGCIGSLDAVRPLYEDAMANAYKSAFADPRLPRLRADEFEHMDVKISVLGPMESLAAADRDQLLAVLEPGVDGLLLVADGFRATFLPAVWERVASPAEFVDLLLRKGRAAGDWIPQLKAFRYRTIEYHQPGPRPPVALG